MANLEETTQKFIDFLKTDIWRIRMASLGGLKFFAVKIVRIILLSIRGFSEDKLPLRASALTFYSLLSLVPVLAMIFGIAKGFGFQSILEKRLLENFSGQKELLTQLMGYANSMLQSTKGGLIAGIGVAILFWTVVKVLGNIEQSFNDIWGIKRSRTFGRKFSDYLSMMLIGPLLLIMSGSITVFIISQITSIMDKISLSEFVSPIIFFLLKFLPYGLLWILFTVIYILMPNTKVRIRSGLFAGIIAGTFYQVAQWIYINFQIGTARYNAIYGSFTALPLFLVWLQISWIIVLLGAEISFAHQHVDTFEYEPDSLHISLFNKRLIALCVSHQLVKTFVNDETPLTAVQISQKLEIPIRLTRQMLNDLVESKAFSITQLENNNEPAYQPARDINKLTIQYVIEAMDRSGTGVIHVKDSEEADILAKSLESFHEKIENSPENKLLKDI
ncbi:YihY/virulence factor BrkB family protein [Thermodesulfobacteriota bacterium]